MKIPFAYPYGISHLVNYNCKNSEHEMSESLKRPWTLADFGSGLSYTSFTYNELKLSDTLIANSKKTITASVICTNTGNREGYESVLWFITDEVGSITRPWRELKYFEKKFLKPEKSVTLHFTIDPMKDLTFPDNSGRLLLENGYFTVSTGNKTASFKLKI
jgi:beta-glucosidase